jgi:hypothetical protein
MFSIYVPLEIMFCYVLCITEGAGSEAGSIFYTMPEPHKMMLASATPPLYTVCSIYCVVKKKPTKN